MKRKILSLLMATLLVVGILGLTTGCVGGNYDITIGLLAPLSGDHAEFGESVQRAVRLYIEQHNERGGLQIGLLERDDEGNPAIAATMYRDLAGRDVTAIIGAVTSGPTMAVVPLAYADNMPMITPTATAAGVTVNQATGDVFTNMFRICFIDPFQGYTMANFAVEELGAQTAAILYNNEIDYSVGLTEAFVAQAAEINLNVIERIAFQSATVDFSGQLALIAQTNPDVLFVPAYHEHVARIGPQSADVAGLQDTILLGPDGWARIMEVMSDMSSLQNSFFLSGFSPESDDPMVVDFINAYRERHGNVPDMFAAQGFDAAKMLIAAIERTLEQEGFSTDNAQTDEFRTALIAQLAATDDTGVTGHLTFDEYNNPQKTAFVMEIIDNRISYWGAFPR